MRAFIETFHCQSGGHCRVCRDREAGRPWRISIMRVFDTPGIGPDWPCPHSLAWGFPGGSRGLGDLLARLTARLGIRPCGGCRRRQALLNRLSRSAAQSLSHIVTQSPE
jgi:hypothetical protein